MQSSKEKKGEIRKLFSVISAKKWRKTIKWEILDRDLFKKIRDTEGTFHGHNKGQKWYGPNRSIKY